MKMYRKIFVIVFMVSLFSYKMFTTEASSIPVASNNLSYSDCSAFADIFKTIPETSGSYYYKYCYRATCTNGVYNKANMVSNSGYRCQNGNFDPYINVSSDGCADYEGECSENTSTYCTKVVYIDCEKTSSGDYYSEFGELLNIDVQRIVNRKYAVNEEIDIEDFRIIGEFSNEAEVDITSDVTIDPLTEVGLQKTFVTYKGKKFEIELEGFIPSFTLSTDYEKLPYYGCVKALDSYVTIDDDRYWDYPIEYELISGSDDETFISEIKENAHFDPVTYGIFKINICVKDGECKLLTLEVEPRKVSSLNAGIMRKEIIFKGETRVEFDVVFNTTDYDKELVKIESLNPDVATYEDGYLNIYKHGKVKLRIYADYYGYEEFFEVNIVKLINEISFDNDVVEVELGDTYEIIPNLTPADSNEDYIVYYNYGKTSNYIDENNVFHANEKGDYRIKVCSSKNICNEFLLKVIVPITQFSFNEEFLEVSTDHPFYLLNDSEFSIYVNINNDASVPIDIEWSFSKDDMVEFIKKDGMRFYFKAKKQPGSVIITGTLPNGLTDSFEVNIVKRIHDFWFNNDSINVVLGDVVKLNPYISPLDYTEKIDVRVTEGYRVDEELNFYADKVGTAVVKLCVKYSCPSIKINVLKPITKFEIKEENIVVNKYDSFDIHYEINDDAEEPLDIKWTYSVSNPFSNIYYQDGVITFTHGGSYFGKVVVTATLPNGLSDSFTVTVFNPILDISFKDYFIHTTIGTKKNIGVIFNPTDTNMSKKITWLVKNNKKGYVDANNNFVATGVGDVEVCGTTVNGISRCLFIYIEYPNVPRKITFAQYDTNDVKLSWEHTGNKYYYVYRATSKNGKYTKIATTSKLYYVDKSISNGKTYYYKVKNDNGYTAVYSYLTPPSKPNITVSNYGFDTLKITYKKVTGATKYEIYRSTSKTGKYVKVGTITGTTFYDKKLSYNKTYYYKVRACNKNNLCGSYSSYKSKKVSAGKPSITLSSSGGTGIKIKYKKVSYATKYQIYRSTSKSKNYKLIKETNSLSFTDKVIPGVTYYYKVRACGGTQCGSYSSVKSKKLTLNKTSISKISLNKNKEVVLNFKKIDGAVGYQIYRSTKKSSGFKKIGTTTTNSYIDKPALGKTYYYKIKVYTKNGTKVIYSSYSSVKSIKVK